MDLLTRPYTYQEAAVNKLAPLRVGAFFMDMGTGKTLTALNLIARKRRKISRVLWFCPVALKLSTQREIREHVTPEQCSIYVFDDRTRSGHVPTALVYIIGIESMSSSARLKLMAAALADERSMVIVDESSYIKTHSALRTRWIIKLAERCRYRLLLTGTPVSQGIVDLYSQMRFLSPDILGYQSFYSFARNHLEYSKKRKGLIVRALNQEVVAAKIAPYVYQITKEECLDLPEKRYVEAWCSMTPAQRDLYERAKDELLLGIQDRDIEAKDIFRLFTALQQITCGFWNRITHSGRGAGYVRTEELIEVPHGRLKLLAAKIDEIPQDAKVIIWTKYRRCIGEIAALLQERYGETTSLFYGDLSEKERAAERELFRGYRRFFTATESTGGHGLTLNEAHYSIFYTNGFKYSERAQAEDRNHRIGQEFPVTYIDIGCDGSIDDRVVQALRQKKNVVEVFREEVKRLRDRNSKFAALKAL